MRHGRNVLIFLLRTTFKNHSKQPSEKNEPDPTSRLDSTCLFLSKILRLQIHFSLKRKTENSSLHAEKFFFENRFDP